MPASRRGTFILFFFVCLPDRSFGEVMGKGRSKYGGNTTPPVSEVDDDSPYWTTRARQVLAETSVTHRAGHLRFFFSFVT